MIKNFFKKNAKKFGLLRANKIGKQYRIMGHEILRLVSPVQDERATNVYQKLKVKTIEKVKDW